MVIRICAVLVCLLLCVTTSPVTQATAGGPPVCSPPPCYPAPCQPGPPLCGPPSPFGICGGILGMCSGICGTVFALPSAVMGGLLAPPPAFRPACAPPVCAPPMAPAPYCAPPMPPVRIGKCKPIASRQAMPPVAYAPQAPQYLPAAYAPATLCGMRRPSGPGCMAFCGNLLEMPVRLMSGVLSVAPLGPFCGTFAAAAGPRPAEPPFAAYW